MTDTMIEKAARAIYDVSLGLGPDAVWTPHNAARAALQATRRPDANACEAAERATGISKALANQVFTAMIDAILESRA